MDGALGNTSVMSFGKVPCTPITGVHVNFYDIFGDVERVGTGSSCASSRSTVSISSGKSRISDELLLDEGNKSLVSAPLYCYNCKEDIFGCAKLDPYISFLQDKQAELLSSLHQEIRLLKNENTDLKFQIHVIFRQQEEGTPMLENSLKKATDTSKIFRNEEEDKQKINRLELELESATRMIEELKWIQQHYEKRIKLQENKIDHLIVQLQRQQRTYDNFEPFPFEVIPSLYTSQPGTPDSASVGGRQPQFEGKGGFSPNRGMSSNRRRSSAQSILPENYKEPVATLPPIKNYELSTPSTSLTPSTHAANVNKFHSKSASKARKSSLTNLNSQITPQKFKNNFNFDI